MSGNNTALIALEIVVIFPIICCGIEYMLTLAGPKKILIKYLSE
jgi:hypothetical protein